jgi:hypothetical protein
LPEGLFPGSGVSNLFSEDVISTGLTQFDDFSGLQNPRMIFSEKGRGAPFLRKNHPLNQQCRFFRHRVHPTLSLEIHVKATFGFRTPKQCPKDRKAIKTRY